MNRKVVISFGGLILLVILSLVIFRIMSRSKKKEEKVRDFLPTKYVETQSAEYKDYNAEFFATGRVISNRSIDIYSEVTGIMDISYDKFKVGNSFKKGDILIKIVDDETKLSYLAQKSDFLSLLTSIMSDLKIDYPDSYDKWNKYISNYSIEGPLADLPQVSSNKEKFFLASRKIFQTYYNLKNLEVRLNKYTIYAPTNGTVVESLVDAGTLIRVNQKLGKFSGIGDFELELSLTPESAELVSIGSPISAYSLENNRTYQGRLIRISRAIDPTTQTIKAYASITGDKIYEGMYMNAKIIGQSLKNVISVPRKAIYNNEFVYVNENGKLNKKNIELVKLGENIAYIKGLNNGEEIIVEPLTNVALGMKVETIKK